MAERSGVAAAQGASGAGAGRRGRRAGAMALLAGAGLALAGCGGSSRDLLANVTAPCPRVALLGEAADLTRFRGGARDLTGLELDGRLTGFQAKCDYGPGRQGLDVTLTLGMTVERGPAAVGRTAQIPYMVAVVTGDETQVLSRASFAVPVEFPNNVSRLTLRSEELSIRIPGPPQEAATRTVLLGFVLTPEELALNRARGPR
ncbi:hypothetical protein LPC08_12395 [Roseomonas sp. OT10]|uniref:hypothetical protein n=1 Tax=Roseomonas cutis TaxID=2897332 RepID=UPI001E648A01|nr:hypothetical protein [Roseomonas sp. OT10]UFN46831.1 hypothetical protein LPC08_12395 [Roseomonas sp. OT10]